MASMAIPFSPQRDLRLTHLRSEFLPKNHPTKVSLTRKNRSLPITCSLVKTVQSPGLDRHVEKQNKTRFVQKLKTLLLSKPRHFLPLHIASKCRSYLALSTPKSILAMIKRYPTVFELFTMPWPSLPLHAAKSFPQLCVRLTPEAEAIAAMESQHRASVVDDLARKLHRLLMISSHRRLLLTKLVHIAPDLGLPPNFRSRLCNDYPERFKIVDTSYGRALELVFWDADLARAFPARLEPGPCGRGLIVDRPLKFKHLRLRKGLNVKRAHRNFLIKFGEREDVCPYTTPVATVARASVAAEKRACAVVREVLAMTVEKRTLIDHVTHFRKEFGLPNKLRGLIVRHPELFYVSVKGLRDSVMLVEGYDDDEELLEKDGSLEIKKMFMKLVRDGKRMRRERKRAWNTSTAVEIPVEDEEEESDVDALEEDYEDGFEHLFEEGSEEYDGGGDTKIELLSYRNNAEFWTAHHAEPMEPW